MTTTTRRSVPPGDRRVTRSQTEGPGPVTVGDPGRRRDATRPTHDPTETTPRRHPPPPHRPLRPLIPSLTVPPFEDSEVHSRTDPLRGPSLERREDGGRSREEKGEGLGLLLSSFTRRKTRQEGWGYHCVEVRLDTVSGGRTGGVGTVHRQIFVQGKGKEGGAGGRRESWNI